MNVQFFWDDPLSLFVMLLMHFVPVLMPLVPGLLVALWARRQLARVESRSADPSSIESAIDGAGAASAILAAGDASGRRILTAKGPLANFYDPSRGELRLSKAVALGRTPEALGLAAHEAGHALQDAQGYWPLKARTPLVLAAKLGNGVAWMTLLAGTLMLTPILCLLGAVLYTAVVLALLALQVIERDANRRSRGVHPLNGLEESPTTTDEPFLQALDAARWAEIAATLPNPRAWWRKGWK